MYKIILTDDSVVIGKSIDYNFNTNFISVAEPQFGSIEVTLVQKEVIVPIHSIKVILGQ